MSPTTGEKTETLNVCLGTYPHTRALKNGEITVRAGDPALHRGRADQRAFHA